jgi:hypothetical protein
MNDNKIDKPASAKHRYRPCASTVLCTMSNSRIHATLLIRANEVLLDVLHRSEIAVSTFAHNQQQRCRDRVLARVISAKQHEHLSASMRKVEQHYFAAPEGSRSRRCHSLLLCNKLMALYRTACAYVKNVFDNSPSLIWSHFIADEILRSTALHRPSTATNLVLH